jgi:hypothetical protein
MDEPKISDELRNMEHEPILPIERKLVAWSIGTGVVLLAALVIISRYF